MSKSALGYLRRQYLCVLRRCAWLNALASGAALVAVAPMAQAQTIVPDGRTQTTLNVNGAVTDITTQTVRGPNAFNSFSRFDVNQGATVNLHLPGATTNLLNLVTDQRSYINGLVNSYRNGTIGGNVYFFNPLGIVVGQGGVINTGSLTLAAPNQVFMDLWMGPSGAISDAATQLALAGQVPLSASGLISVQGQINAPNGVTLAGSTVNVEAGASVRAGGAAQIAFGNLVNVDGAQQAAALSIEGGTIRIVAAKDVNVGGEVTTDGHGKDADGGAITMAAKRIDIQDGSEVLAQGDVGRTAGNINIEATDNQSTPVLGSLDDSVASVKIGKAVIQGGDVSITATANDKWVWTGNEYAVQVIKFLDSVSVGADVTISRAQATVDVGNGANIDAQGTLDIKAHAIADASMKVASTLAGFGYGETDSVAKVTIGDATLGSDKAMTLSSQADSTLSVEVSTVNTGALNNAASSASQYANVSLAIGAGHQEAVTTVGADAKITRAETLEVGASGEKKHKVAASGGSFKDGTAASGVAVLTSDTTITASLGGHVSADQVTVKAELAEAETEVKASAGTGGSGDDLSDAISSGKTPDEILFESLTSTLAKAPGTDARSGSSGKLGLSASFAWAENTNDVTAAVADSARITTPGDLNVLAKAEEKVSFESSAEVDQRELDKKAEGDTKTPEQKKQIAISASVVVADMDHHANALIGDGAVINTGGAVNVNALSAISPFWSDWSSLIDQFKTMNWSGADAWTDLGSAVQEMVANPIAATTWSKTAVESEKQGFAGSVNFFDLNNKTMARIGAASVNAGVGPADAAQDVNVVARATQGILNLSGVPEKVLETSVDGGASGFGGSYLQFDLSGGTDASIAQGATVRADDVVVQAHTSFDQVDVTETVGKAAKESINGAFSLLNADLHTVAQIGAGGGLSADDVLVQAKDDSLVINVAGGVARSGSVGIGFSVAINDINREVLAIVGNRDGENGVGGTLTAAGNVLLDAQASNALGAFTVAGSGPSAKEDDAGKTGGDGTKTNSKDTGEQGKSGVGISAAASINLVNETTSAGIADLSQVTVNGAAGSSVAVDADADGTVDETVSLAAGLKSAAEDRTLAIAGAGSLTVAKDKSAGLAGAFTWNQLAKNTSAYLSDASVDATAGAVKLSAMNTGAMWSISASGSGGDKVGIAGSVSYSDVNNVTEASTNDASVNAGGVVSLSATDESDIRSIAGAASYGGKAGFGVGVAISSVASDTFAGFNGGTVNGAGGVQATAISNNAIFSVAAALSASKGVGFAGSVSWNDIDNRTEASSTDTVVTSSGNDVNLDADDTSDIKSIAGSAAFSGGSATVGIALAKNDISNETLAQTERGSLSGKNVRVEATENATIVAYAVGGSGGAKNALAGSVGINTIDNTTTASAKEAALVATNGLVKVHAFDTSTINSVTGAAAVGGSNAVGASGSYNHIDGEVKAEISGGSATAANVLVDAERAGTLDVWAISGSAAGTAGIAGSIALNDVGGSTTARIGEAALVNATGNALVTAEADDFIKSRAGAVGLGGSAGGAGGIAFNDMHADTKAEVTGAGTQVTALGQGDAAQVDNGLLSGAGALKDRPQKDDLRGVAVVASSTSEVENVALSAAGGGSAAVAATVSIAMLGGSTTAQVTNGARLNTAFGDAEQEARVAAYHHDTIVSGTGGGAVGGSAGVGGAADTAVVSHVTRAQMDGAQAQAQKAVTIDAASSTDITQAVLAVGGGGYAGLAGTVGVVLLDGSTEALANNAKLDSKGSVKVEATSDAEVDLTAGALAAGGVAGVGLTAAVTVVEQQTRAGVSASSALNANGATRINAASTFEQKNDAYTAAAAGGVGVAGTVNVVVVKGSTDAVVGSGVTVNDDVTYGGASQDVAVTASDDTRVTNRVGSLGVGGVGVGAVADVTLIRNGASARVVSGASITADHDITVGANTVRDVDSTATALAGGYTAGIAGAVSVISVGARPEGDAKDNSTGSVGKAGEMASASATGDQMGSEGSASAARADAARSSVQLSQDLGTTPVATSAAASVAAGATLNAGRHVGVNAHNQTDTDATAVGAAASGGVSIGGGIAIATVSDKTLATLNGNTTAGGNVRVTALDDQPDESLLRTYAGGAGLAGLAASFALHEKSSTAGAYLGGTVNALNGSVTVDAGIDHRLRSDGVAAAAGVAAVGASIAHVVEDSNATAGVNSGARIEARSLDVHGHSQTDTDAKVVAAAGGLISGAGADANAKDTSSAQALIGDNAVIRTASGLTQVRADVDPLAKADAVGVAVAAGVGIGVSMADALVQTTARASTGNAVDIQANALTVQSETRRRGKTAESDALAAAGGALVGASATVSKASALTLTESTVGAGNQLDVAGQLKVDAQSNTSVDADVTGISVGGLLAEGSNTATAKTDTQTYATVGNNPDLKAGSVRVHADGSDTLRANTLAGAGGLGVAVASLGQTQAKSRTYARLGSASGVAGQVDAALVDVSASQHVAFNTHADSTSASAVGFSGARAINRVDTDTRATVGQNLTVNTQDFNAEAWNDVLKTGTGYDVDSGSGGLLNGAAALSQSTINNSARVDVEKGVNIQVDVAGVATGSTNFAAHNTVNAKDTVRLDSGGAIAIAKAESVLRSETNSAQVNVGEGATVFSDGDINASARADVVLNANARSKTYGLAGASEGASTASIDANNQVNIGTNATVQSDGENVNLMAGTNGSQTNNLNANADTRLWNYTAIPVENDPQADARILQHNTINVAGGAQVRAVKDISLNATEGRHTTRGFGEGTDAYRETLSAIGDFFGADTSSLKITGGSTYDNATAFGGLDPASGVNVDGTVQSGIWHHQFLTLAADGMTVTTSEDMADKYSFRNNVNLATELSGEIAALKAKADQVRAAANSYSGTDAADAADALDNDARILQAQLDKLNASPLVGFIDIHDTTARTGNVNISGKYLTGAASGHIEAPGDVRIDIENQSTRFMQTSKLTIPDEGGGRVTFNGLSVDSGVAINERNSLTKKGSFDATVVSALTSAAPVIRVENTNSNDIAGLDSPAQLWMRGDVNNLGGEAVAKSHGTLRVSAKINAETVNIATGGDFIQTYTPGFTHQGGDPIAQLGALPDNRETAAVDYSTNSLPARTCSADPKSCSTTIAGNNVYISGQKLNINGIIQAGLPDRQMVIDAGLTGGANATLISNARAAWLASPGTATRYLELNNPAPESSAIKVRYDAQYDRLELDNVRMGGGHMELFGDIFSTGNGELRVMDGYGRINVTNSTGYDLAVGRLDTGPGVEGMIHITDTSQRDPFNKPLVTEITRLGNTIETRTSATIDADGNPTNLIASTTGRNATFQPLANRRFNWINGERTQTDEDRVYTTRVLFGVDFLWPDSDPPDSTSTSNVYSARLTGDWLSVGGGSANYTMDYSRYSSGTYKYKDDYTTRDGVLCVAGACAKEDITTHKYYRTVVNEYYLHSLNASKNVAVTFTGFDAHDAQLRVDAGSGQLLLGGLVRGLTGDTALNGGAGIQQLNDDARIVASNLTLTSANGAIGGALNASQGAVGAENKAISIDLTDASQGLTDGTVSAFGRDGVVIKEIGGDLRVKAATASNGDITLIADRNLLESAPGTVVTGNNINLVALSGQIGDALDPFRIETQGNVSTFSAHAAGNIHVAEQTGDLRVVDVKSQAGDVALGTPGNLLDANTIETVDEFAKADLLNLWNEMALRGGEADTALDRSLLAQQNALKQSYETYFRMRRLHLNDDGSYSADAYRADYAFKATPNQASALKAANGWNDADLASYEASQTQAYHASHARFGGGDYVVGFSPTLTDAETAALSKGHKWNDAQLANAISAGLLKETSDTNIRIEAPNVTGRTVSLTAGGSIGSDLGEVVITKGTEFGSLSDAQKLVLLTAERNDLTVSDTEIRIAQHEDFNVTSEVALNATAGGNLYVSSEQSLNIDQVQAVGEARVKTSETLSAVAGKSNVLADSIVLEAGKGDIGSAATPMVVDLGAGKLTARSGRDIYIREATGDMVIESVFAKGDATLVADGSILEAQTDRSIDVRADNINLTAGDTIGQSGQDKSLDVAVDAKGTINASAPNGVYLNSTGGSGGLGNITTAGRFEFSVDQGSIDVNGVVSADAGVVLGASDNVNFAGGQVRSSGADVSLTGGTDGSGSVNGDGNGVADVVAGGPVTVVAANDIGGGKPLQVEVAEVITLRATNIDAQVSPLTAGNALSVTATGPVGDVAQNVNLDFTRAGPVVFPTLVLHNGKIRTDGADLSVVKGYLGDAVTFVTPFFGARIDHIVRSTTPGLDVRAFTLDNDFSLTMTAGGVQLNDLIINQDLLRNITSTPAGVADVLSAQSLQTLQRQLPREGDLPEPLALPEDAPPLVDVEQLSMADLPADVNRKAP